MRIMSMDFRLLVFVVQNLIPRCIAQQYPEWKGGDWAFESLQFTDEPIGNTNEWAHYLHTLGDEYDEYPDWRKQKKEFITPSEQDLKNDPPDWYPLAPNEDPYLAVVYRRDLRTNEAHRTFFPNDPEPKGSLISPGTACGGALLSPRHVLTSCGCLVTLITRFHKIGNPLPHGFRRYDIHDEDNQLDTVYVIHTVTEFAPDFKHEIDMDPKKWSPYPSMSCKDTLLELGNRYRDYDAGKKEAVVNAAPIVLPFTPEIRPNFFRYFPKWPPVAINLQTDRTFQQRIDLISIGMRLVKPGRLQFFSSISASATELIHCRVRTGIVCNESRIRFGVSHTCYCPLRPGIQKLIGGVIGWPLVQKGYLVGITGSERHPSDGTVVANTMHHTLIEQIERYVTKKVLEEQNTPPPEYRARELKRQYLLYDYNNFKWKTIVRPESKGTTNSPTLITFSVTIIFWISPACNISFRT